MKLNLFLKKSVNSYMAELLIKNFDTTNPDPVKDRRGCIKKGMVIDIRPDGFRWGSSEGPPNAIILKLPKVDVKDVAKYLEPEYNGTEKDEFGNDQPILYRRRLWRVKLEDLPVASKTALTDKGSLTVAAKDADCTWDEVKSYIVNLSTGLSETAKVEPKEDPGTGEIGAEETKP